MATQLAHMQWRIEAGSVLPESILDQIEEETGGNLMKQVEQTHRLVTNDTEVVKIPDNEDWKAYLAKHLKATHVVLTFAQARHMDPKKQIQAVVCWYLKDKLKTLSYLQSTPACIPQLELKNISDVSDEDLEISLATLSRRSDLEVKAGQKMLSEMVASQELRPNVPVRFKQCRPAFMRTEAFSNVLQKLHGGKKIVHIYGLSGNGKSQIIRAVCGQFAKDDPRCSVWHTQCVEGSHVLRDSWTKLVHNMEERGHITATQNKQALCGLEENRCQEFASYLGDSGLQMLLCIEDVTLQEKELVQSAISHLHSATTTKDHKIQLLIATRKRTAIFSELDLDSMPYYITHRIDGFTPDEAKDFLTIPGHSGSTEDAISKLAQALAYSPLRLTLAKGYCVRYRISYDMYLDRLGKDKGIIDKEKEILQLHPELAEHHGYEVIKTAVNSLAPTELKVIQLMSFLSNEDIPDALLGRFFQELQDSDVRKEEYCIRTMLHVLEEDSILHTSYPSNICDYGKGSVSTHYDILLAVNLDIPAQEKEPFLVKALHAMINIMSKDNRSQESDILLSRLVKHVNLVVKHATRFLKIRFNLKSPKLEAFQLQTGLSWLYTVVGHLNTQQRMMQDGYFRKAIEYLWKICCTYSSNWCCLTGESGEDLLDFKPEKDPDITAQKVYARVKVASGAIPKTFIEEHFRKFFSIRPFHVQDMREMVGEHSQINWDEIVNQVNEKRILSDSHIKLLCANKMLLSPSELKKIFLAERIASVLHSRGRQVLYLQDTVPFMEQKRYEWYTGVGLKLTQAVFADTGIRTAFEHYLEANNKLPRLLQNRQNENDKEFTERLKLAKKIANKVRNPNGAYFEHGIRRMLSGAPYGTLNGLKYIVKANTKLHKRPHLLEQLPRDDALSECNALYRFAKEHASFVMAPNCRMQAGKYYAAVKNYDKAFEAFESAFDDDYGITNLLEKQPNTFAWAVYNTGKAICEGANHITNLDKHKERFQVRYEMAVRQEITLEWRVRLQTYKDKIDNMRHANLAAEAIADELRSTL